MNKSNFKKIAVALMIMALLSAFFSITCFAAPVTTSTLADVAENVKNDVLGQIKTIFNNVVFPVLSFGLLVTLIVVGVTQYFNHRNNGKINWTAIILLIIGFLICATAPLYIWSLVGL